jgi:hypothetical protein
VILVDDPHPTWEAAQSPTHRRHVNEWFDGTLYDRGEPGATIIVLMHRWHEGDLAGHLIEEHEDDWQVIRLPALAEEKGDPLGRKVGDPLCPARYDRTSLLSTAAAVGQHVWQAKYQQAPLEVGGGRVYHSYLPERNDDKRARTAARPAAARVASTSTTTRGCTRSSGSRWRRSTCSRPAMRSTARTCGSPRAWPA